MRKKKCPICKEWFMPKRGFQATCENFDCMIAFGKQKQAKKKRKTKREYKANDRTALLVKAQKIFNKFIRLRDKDLPCISCGKIIGYNEVSHASHFRPATNSRLRFDERNVHRSCVKCNVFLSSNAIEYKKALIKKLGAEVVEELESTNAPYKYSVEELKEIIKKYRTKNKELESLS